MVIDLNNRGGGHPTYYLPLGGGEVSYTDNDQDIRIEVAPNVDMRNDEWRDHKAIFRLADLAEKAGGFMWSNDDIHIDKEILAGRDVIHLLAELNRRALERAQPGKEGTDAAYRQGFEAARRQMEDQLRSLHYEKE